MCACERCDIDKIPCTIYAYFVSLTMFYKSIVIKNTQIALELKMSPSTTFTLCDLSRHCVLFQDQILTMFSIL